MLEVAELAATIVENGPSSNGALIEHLLQLSTDEAKTVTLLIVNDAINDNGFSMKSLLEVFQFGVVYGIAAERLREVQA